MSISTSEASPIHMIRKYHFLMLQVYIAEISPVKLRGVFTSLNEMVLTAGMVVGFGVGAIQDFPYFYGALVAVGILAVFEIAMVWLPDTPQSLVARGYSKSAERALRLLRGKKHNIKGELNDIKESVLSRRKEGNGSVWLQFKKRRVLVPFTYVLVILFFTQGGGISTTASYAAPIFSNAGVSNPRVTAIYAVGVASLLGNIASFFSVDILGRKILLILSALGMMVGSITLGTHFFITRPSIQYNDASCDRVRRRTMQLSLCPSGHRQPGIIPVLLFHWMGPHTMAVGLGAPPTLSERYCQRYRHVSHLWYSSSSQWGLPAVL